MTEVYHQRGRGRHKEILLGQELRAAALVDERRALCYTPFDPGGTFVDDLDTHAPDHVSTRVQAASAESWVLGSAETKFTHVVPPRRGSSSPRIRSSEMSVNCSEDLEGRAVRRPALEPDAADVFVMGVRGAVCDGVRRAACGVRRAACGVRTCDESAPTQSRRATGGPHRLPMSNDSPAKSGCLKTGSVGAVFRTSTKRPSVFR